MDNFPEDYFVPLNYNGIITDYKINSYGIVKGILTEYITPIINPQNNRKSINIYINKSKHKISLARAILSSFIHPPRNDYDNYEADHIDGDPYNDQLSNLQWLTSADNKYKSIYVEDKVVRGENVKIHKFTQNIIDRIKIDIGNNLTNTEIKKKYENIVNINNSDISSIRYKIKWGNSNDVINYDMYNIRKYHKDEKDKVKNIIRRLYMNNNTKLPSYRTMCEICGYEYNDSTRHFLKRMIKEIDKEIQDPENIEYLTKKVKIHINEKSDKRICKFAMIPATDDNINKVRKIRKDIMKKYNLNKKNYNIIIPYDE